MFACSGQFPPCLDLHKLMEKSVPCRRSVRQSVTDSMEQFASIGVNIIEAVPSLYLDNVVLRQQSLSMITSPLPHHSSHLTSNAAVCLCSGAVPSRLVIGGNDDNTRMTNVCECD